MGTIVMKEKRVLQEYNRTVHLIPFTLDDNEYFDGMHEPDYNLTAREKEFRRGVRDRIAEKIMALGCYKYCMVDFFTMKISAEIA